MPDAKSIVGYNESEAAHKRRVAQGKEAMLMAAPIAKTNFDWATFTKKLPLGSDENAVALRKKLWKVFDLNGNNMVSLAEFDRGLQAVFASKESLPILDVLFRAKPAIARAFHAARAADQGKGDHHRRESDVLNQRAGLNVDEYISYSEFQPLLHYFRQYMELWLMFEAVDTGGLNYTTGCAGAPPATRPKPFTSPARASHSPHPPSAPYLLPTVLSNPPAPSPSSHPHLIPTSPPAPLLHSIYTLHPCPARAQQQDQQHRPVVGR